MALWWSSTPSKVSVSRLRPSFGKRSASVFALCSTLTRLTAPCLSSSSHLRIYQCFQRSVESVNVIIATYNDELLGDCQVYPEKGTVSFGSGLHQWGFTLCKFARMYSEKFGIGYHKMMQKLWGDNYFDAKGKKWVKSDRDGQLERAFCQFIMTYLQDVRGDHGGQEAEDPEAPQLLA